MTSDERDGAFPKELRRLAKAAGRKSSYGIALELAADEIEHFRAALHGPYGYLVGPKGLGEDELSLESDPSDSPHFHSFPLYALIDVVQEAAKAVGEAEAAASIRNLSQPKE